MEVHEEPGEELDEELDDIQWLKASYKRVLERESKLVDFLIEKLEDFDLRIRALEAEG